MWGEKPMIRRWADQLLEWYEAGEIDVYVDRVFRFDQAAEAHCYMQERRNRGKIILVP
jgi:NADPH:quinone reductase-like Zn-dependent oxidoreductase